MTSQATHGSEADFETLIGPLGGPGLRLAYSMLGDRAEAEDATQEAIAKAWRRLPQLREPGQIRPWFLAIVANNGMVGAQTLPRKGRPVQAPPFGP